MTSPGDGLDDDCNSATDDDVDDDDDSTAGDDLDDDGEILSRSRCWITRSWRIVSHFARMWAGGVGGISSFMGSGRGGNGGFTRQSNDRAWVNEFWGGERIE